jgi:hypothetical protein
MSGTKELSALLSRLDTLTREGEEDAKLLLDLRSDLTRETLDQMIETALELAGNLEALRSAALAAYPSLLVLVGLNKKIRYSLQIQLVLLLKMRARRHTESYLSVRTQAAEIYEIVLLETKRALSCFVPPLRTSEEGV